MSLKHVIALSLLLFAQAARADVRISQLPLGSAAATTVGDSIPYVDSLTGTTQRLGVWDLVNIPGLFSSPTISTPTITGAMTGSTATFSGAVLMGSTSGVSSNFAGYSQFSIINTNTSYQSRLNLWVGSSGGSGEGEIEYAPGLFFGLGVFGNDTSTPIEFFTNNATVQGSVSPAGLWTIGASGGSQTHVVNGALSTTGNITDGGISSAGAVVSNSSGALSSTTSLSVNYLNAGSGASSSTYWRGDGTWATPSGGGGTTVNTTAKTSSYSASGSDCSTVLEVNPSSTFSVTMPSPSSNANCEITIVNVATGTYVVTISPYSSETFGIPAFASLHLSTSGELWTLKSDGTNWQILRHYASTGWQSYTPSDGSGHVIGAGTTAPTLGSGYTLKAYWRRNGDTADVRWEYNQTSSGSSGSGNYFFPLPSGYTARSAVIQTSPGSPAANQALGAALYESSNASNNWTAGTVNLYSSSAVETQFGNGIMSGAAGVWFNSTTLNFGFEAEVPITNWEP